MSEEKRVIITIGREYGSGGHEIGQKLADRLGINFYDRSLIELTAARSGLNPNVVSSSDEKAPSLFSSPYSPTISDQLFYAQCDLLQTLADNESFVVVGRCGNAVLRERAKTLDVFIFAPLDVRIKRVMDLYMVPTAEKAKKEIQKIDKARRTYYQYYTEYNWGQRDGHDLIINSSLCGIDGTVDVLERTAKAFFGID